MVEIASVGEVMIEHIRRVTVPSHPDSTLVLEPQPHAIGGAVVNVAWYLSGFGRYTALVSAVGDRDIPLLLKLYGDRRVDLSGVVALPGMTDQLISLLTAHHHHSYYLLAELPDGCAAEMLRRTTRSDVLVLSGGRHRPLRQIYRALTVHEKRFVVFNPSYAVYEYAPDELMAILGRASLVVVNEDEYSFVQRSVPMASLDAIARRGGVLVVTRGPQGATVFSRDGTENYVSRTFRDSIVIGAGDAFLAGYLHEFLRTDAVRPSVVFGLEVAAEVVRRDEIRIKVREAEVRNKLDERPSHPSQM